MTHAERFDVAVVGGGPAGIAAALGAARHGARTLLIERERQLGGNVSQALVHTLCGLYREARAGKPPAPAHPGLPLALERLLRAREGAGEPVRSGRVYWVPIDPDAFASLCASLCDGQAALRVLLEAPLVGASFCADEARLRHAADAAPVVAKLVIDTTGDAAVAAAAGCVTAAESQDRRQLPSYLFEIEGVRAALDGSERLALTRSLAVAAREGRALPDGSSLTLRPGLRSGTAWATLTPPRREDASCTAGLASEWIESATRRASDAAASVVAHLRATQPGFADCAIRRRPARIGLRETRRIVGLRVITRPDLLGHAADPESVVVSSWPLELWHTHRGATYAYPDAPAPVPLGALIHRDQPRLGAAGRCLSASHEALGALRVIGTALATGEAIGVAAALAADAGVTLADVEPGAVRAGIEMRAGEALA